MATIISSNQVDVDFSGSGAFASIDFSSPQAAASPELFALVFGFQAAGPVNFVQLAINQAHAAGDGFALSFLQICPNGSYDSGGNCSATETTLAAFQDVTGTGDLQVNTSLSSATVGFLNSFSVDGGTNGSAFASGSTIAVGQVPEPASIFTAFAGVAGLAAFGFRSKSNKLNQEKETSNV